MVHKGEVTNGTTRSLLPYFNTKRVDVPIIAASTSSLLFQEPHWISPAPAGDVGSWLRDTVSCMGPWVGLILGGICAVAILATLYGVWLYRKRRRTAKVRRHVSMMQAGDASLHMVPGCSSWSAGVSPLPYEIPVPTPACLGSPMGVRSSQNFPQLIASRPRQASIDSVNVGSGITLKAEVLDPSYYHGTIKKKTRMNGDLAQAIAVFGLPAARMPSFGVARKSARSKVDDMQDLPSNMEVVYQERTAL
ncbi:uncharacterized protein LOC111263532 isoform X1 [Varroa jacobsoni]|uniref:uncharacterized protein LOC111263532 isoform X1 n=1 Tax=Varroa jacobsoni TaxID=62625 RepID=UPI000BF3BC19|nr:uncharacterized protein LOC111263532 isoform X1 [Varroa jacobsoni]